MDPKNHKQVSFTLDMTNVYPDLFLECAIPEGIVAYHYFGDLYAVIWGGEVEGYTQGTVGVFIANKHLEYRQTIPDPIGLVVMPKGFLIATMAHEMFHAARFYFRLMVWRINTERDEKFAHLLSDLMESFRINYRIAKKEKK